MTLTQTLLVGAGAISALALAITWWAKSNFDARFPDEKQPKKAGTT